MSLARLAVRIITARALYDTTLAGTRVYDSAVDGIDLQIGNGQREPFLVVYTDDHDRPPESGRDLRHGKDALELVIEAAVAAPVVIETDGESMESVEIPATDAGLEVIIDLIGHQITGALMGHKTVWSDLWHDFVMNVDNTMSRRGASSVDGARIAARQMVMTCDIVADPVSGAAIPDLWNRFLAAVEATPDIAHLGAIIRHALQSDGPLVGWREVGSTLGLGEVAVNGIGLETVTDAQGAPVEFGEAVLDIAGPDITVTETLPPHVGG